MRDNAAPVPSGPPLVLLTRPHAASDRFAAQLRAALGAASGAVPEQVRIAIVPLMAIVPVVAPRDLDEELAGASALIFTSAAGVEVFAGLIPRRDWPAWCVGDRTASAARAVGLSAVSAGGDAAALVALLTRVPPAGLLVHLHGVHTRGDVAERLTQAGLRVAARAIYDQRRVTPGANLVAALRHTGPIIAPLFSPRSARLLSDAVGNEASRIMPVALSQAVRAALPGPLAARAAVADSPDAAAMIRAIAARLAA